MTDKKNILLIGEHAKESALAWKLLQSPCLATLYTSPGVYPGAIHVTGLDPRDFEAVADFVEKQEIDLVVAGDAKEIVDGIADALSETRAQVIAPDAECARLEGSKEFAKEFMSMNAIPSARFMTVTTDTYDEGLGFLESLPGPYVLKADGLASGRGVVIVHSLADAKDCLRDMLDGLFGEASSTVVLEEYLDGKECSVFVATDSKDYIILPTARDYKRLLDGDNGPNTAGMGSISPAPGATEEFISKVRTRIIEPTFRGLEAMDLKYRGFLYFGIIDIDGEPMLIEYNVRLGDPEAQAIIPRIKNDMVDLLIDIAEEQINRTVIQVSDDTTVSVVVAAPGYPSHTVVDNLVTGLSDAIGMGCYVFPGEMKKNPTGHLVSAGGRILTVVAAGKNYEEAARKALEGVEAIETDGKQFRSDIGLHI